MNYRNILLRGTTILKKNNLANADIDAECLLSYSLNKSRENILLNLDEKVNLTKFKNFGRYIFFGRLIILLTDRILSHSPNFGRPKQGQTFVVPTFHIHFLNPECVTIPWVLAPKKFPIENFQVRSDLQKISLFHEFSCPLGKKNRRPAADSILMPPTFHIARLNRYTPNFSGVPQKLTWCQQFGLQIFPK